MIPDSIITDPAQLLVLPFTIARMAFEFALSIGTQALAFAESIFKISV